MPEHDALLWDNLYRFIDFFLRIYEHFFVINELKSYIWTMNDISVSEDMQNDTVISRKLEALQCLICNRAFASSTSALAAELGYTGRATFYRIMSGRVKDDTVEKIWNLIAGQLGLSDDGLYDIYRMFRGCEYLYGTLVGGMNGRRAGWADTLVTALISGRFDCFSEEFKSVTAPVFADLRADEPDVYWGIVVLTYLRAGRIDPYTYVKKDETWRIIDLLDNILTGLYPEKTAARAASAYLKRFNTAPTLWNIMLNCIVMLRLYTENDYMAKAAKPLRVFPFGTVSYWHAPGACYAPGAEVWQMTCHGLGRCTTGLYVALRLKAGRDTLTFTVEDALIVRFWAADGAGGQSMAHVSRCSGGREGDSCFYYYEYDEEQCMMRFGHAPDTGRPLGLPEELRMIDMEEPEGKDEKVWARIMSAWDGLQGEAVFRRACERLTGVTDMSGEYAVKDVAISKTTLTLYIEHGGETKEYRMAVGEYGFLAEINPSHRVVIARHAADGALHADWPDLGYSVKLSEFITG